LDRILSGIVTKFGERGHTFWVARSIAFIERACVRKNLVEKRKKKKEAELKVLFVTTGVLLELSHAL